MRGNDESGRDSSDFTPHAATAKLHTIKNAIIILCMLDIIRPVCAICQIYFIFTRVYVILLRIYSGGNVSTTVQSKLSRDLKLMLTFSVLRNVYDLFLGTFFISFIMQLSANEIISVSMYKLFEYTATVAGFILFANFCKRHNKVTVFALNIIPKIILLSAIILLQERIIDYIVPLGLIYGIGAAMYHLPMNTMVGEKVAAPIMTKYIGIKNSLIHITKIITPVLLGLFITAGSYVETAYVLLGLAVIELALSFMLTPSRHRSRKKIDFKGFFLCMLRFPVIRKLFLIEILRGLSTSGVLATVITMYTVYMFHTDLNLGIFTTIFAACSIFASYLLAKFGTKQKFPQILAACMLVIFGGLSIFIWKTTPITFLIYNFVYATAITILAQICDINMFNLSKSKCVTANYTTEYFVFRDTALFIGRWVGFVILMYIGVFGGYDWLRYYLVGITVAMLIAGTMSVSISQHIKDK